MLCEAPFLGITIDQAGNINMCCNTTDREQFGVKISDVDNLEKFFLGKQYSRLRKQMSTVGMEGIKNCEVCWIVNQGGEAEILNYHRRARQIGSRDLKLRYLEMTTSNICNQTCVMCDSYFSTKWRKIEHYFNRDQGAPLFAMSEKSVDKILDILPNLKILQIKGGEPFADKNNLAILTRLIKVNPDCKVILLSNFHHIPDEWWSILIALKNLQVGASVDGTEKIYDWIRGGSFSQTVNNIQEFNRLVDCTGGFSINMCISIYNLYNVKATQEYFKNYTCNVYNVVQSPMHLSPSIVPKNQLHKIIYGQYGNDTGALSPNLLNANHVIDQDLVDKFHFHTDTMNNIRGFDIYDIEPRLKNIFDE